MKTEIIGGGARSKGAARYLTNAGIGVCGTELVKILPIPSTRDGRKVLGTEVELSSLAEGSGKGVLIAGYGFPPGFAALLDERGIRYFDALYDEEFTLENAELTALGVLSFLLSSMERVPQDARIGIIGYGRIGRALTRILLFHGAHLRVFTGKMENCRSLGEVGVECTRLTRDSIEPTALSGLDVLINTAPTDLSYLFPRGNTEGLRVLEVASGDSFAGVFGVEYLPSLPARLFPESAGAAYGRAIERYLSSVKGGG